MLDDHYHFLGSAFSPSEAICAAAGGLSQEPGHADSLNFPDEAVMLAFWVSYSFIVATIALTGSTNQKLSFYMIVIILIL